MTTEQMDWLDDHDPKTQAVAQSRDGMRCPICGEPMEEHDRPEATFPHPCIGPLRVRITKLDTALRRKEDLIMRMNEDIGQMMGNPSGD